ncbi:uncharacterized protein L969DRAFT_89562 [Mixia osmundae IAM 14324]|uniref:Structural maintenance of chromosomes protein n=1 Tax=Mixia osmundae (strain CBS 9802 / IAM 14324 / JCM 22182 / KY 12970) TaxID=764103 RepID=G7EA48_MIXOS|nr:uncharacterized protein L969DRAFT_89562 [Mixia osmundae IAM 14324]KEI37606.1 hypothetical protein L969DRAFT_89562 [Mixia osmundae IAM 14324]GAA99708.1 hypothetical protein E5Q_06411 [Mixia osmundae IAM 14324]
MAAVRSPEQALKPRLPMSPSKASLLPQSPSKAQQPLSHSAVSAAQTEALIAKNDSRLVIHKLVLHDFKSYAGTQEIGPFHKSFSSIVGPNGSGKSNTIDALLFVFGYRASKMRQAKLSELIHNSEGRENLPSCSVTVHFRSIIDLPHRGPDAFHTIPNSDIIVMREALRNNTSKYVLNGKTSSFSQVTTLLKAKGIDLDHKRFLILQGEVESIAQMKPKAPNEHEDGLLEYLEDIIGTSNYKETLDKAQAEVDSLNEERGEKINRLKLVEREKSALGARKKEADAFLLAQNELAQLQNRLWQRQRLDARGHADNAQTELAAAKERLAAEDARQQGIRDEAQARQTEYDEIAKEYAEVESLTKELVQSLGQLEREEVQLVEQKKHASTKLKKLSKSIDESRKTLRESTTAGKNFSEEIQIISREIEELETRIASEEIKLEAVQESLKGKTEAFTLAIQQEQRGLEPLTARVLEKQIAVDSVRGERAMLLEAGETAAKELADAQARLARVASESATAQKTLSDLIKNKTKLDDELATLNERQRSLAASATTVRLEASAAQSRSEEAKSSGTARTSRGAVLQSLLKLRDQGRLPGFHGRLGDLGRIDDKYDVAISTAAPGLDNLVCDKVETAQACLEHLHRTQIGRATILCLDKLSNKDMSPPAALSSMPAGVERLYDLITPSNARFAPAFFQVLGNTLVAGNLAEAKLVAFGKQRFRVVTRDGNLIDTSGTMSGGGNRISRGAMSSRAPVEEFSPAALAKLQQDADAANAALSRHTAEQNELAESISRSEQHRARLAIDISKITLEASSNEKRLADAQRRISSVSSSVEPSTEERAKIRQLDSSIAKLTVELEAVEASVLPAQQRITELQQKINAAGGTALRTQQVKVQDLRERIEHANERLTKAEVGKGKAERDQSKAEKSLGTLDEQIAACQAGLSVVERDLAEKTKAADAVRRETENARLVLDDKTDDLNKMKTELNAKLAEVNRMSKQLVDLNSAIDKAKQKVDEGHKLIETLGAKLQRLSLHDLADDDENEDQVAEKAQTAELLELSGEELREIETNVTIARIAVLEEQIDHAKPNLSVLKEYRKREAEFATRAQELDGVTTKRDEAKQELERMRKQRFDDFMEGFHQISNQLKAMYQMITLGGNAELELVDSLDPFSEGIIFSVMPPKKSWKNICNLSGGEKTLSSLALVFALQTYKPTPCYFFDEIDAALDFRNVSIIAHWIADRAGKDGSKQAQYIIISLRNDMFELARRLSGVYKVNNASRTLTIKNTNLAALSA